MKNYTLRFDKSAEDSIFGWKNESIPISNSYFGTCIFGGTSYERLQITEPTLWTANCGYIENRFCSGQEPFGEVFIKFDHKCKIKNYVRSLSLSSATASVKYTSGGVDFEREYFSSYPSGVMACRFSASEKGKLNFTLRPEIANLRERLTDGKNPENSGKFGKVYADGEDLVMSGRGEYYGIDFEARMRVVIDGDGELTVKKSSVSVKNASRAYLYFTVATNYRLSDKTFLSPRLEKLSGNPHPHEKVVRIIENAVKKGYEKLKKEHISDYFKYFSSFSFDLGGKADNRTTPALLESYRSGKKEPYLEELFVQMGRYMMIVTSRKGTLPSGMQGKWNAYKIPPWTCGYWYNINQQMNYWFVFSLGLGDLYEAYADFNAARYEKAKINGSTYIKDFYPERFEEGNGKNGWLVGTANSAFEVSGVGKNSHSGPGTSGFTVISDVDKVRYTHSENEARDVYKKVECLSRFYLKCLDNYGGKYLTGVSASPEQRDRETRSYIRTVGCAFDQQMIYETFSSLLEMYESYPALKEECDERVIFGVKEKIDLLDPVIIGASGQVKEFREENYYGDLGEWEHRHVSQLVGLYPGNVINEETPTWLDAARVTLKKRGSRKGPGFGIIHRALLWARAFEGDMSYRLLNLEISTSVFDNLWGCHYDPMPVDRKDDKANFAIDANYGACALISEMLVQSQMGTVKILPALPSAWKKGNIKHLIARGGFDISLSWKNGRATKIEIISTLGGTLKLKYSNISKAKFVCENNVKILDNDTVIIETGVSERILISNVPSFETALDTHSVTAVLSRDKTLIKWEKSPEKDATYEILRAFDSDPNYTFVMQTDSLNFEDKDRCGRQATYKIITRAYGKEPSKGITVTVPSTK